MPFKALNGSPEKPKEKQYLLAVGLSRYRDDKLNFDILLSDLRFDNKKFGGNYTGNLEEKQDWIA